MIKSYKYLKGKEVPIAMNAGKIILGIPLDELGDEFIDEMDRLLDTFESSLKKDVHMLFWMINMRVLALFIGKSFKPFSKMNEDKQIKYIRKLMLSKIPLLRTVYVTLKAVCGWSYYSLEKCWKEMDFKGETIGKEHLTPTLLFGKEPWKPKEGI